MLTSSCYKITRTKTTVFMNIPTFEPHLGVASPAPCSYVTETFDATYLSGGAQSTQMLHSSSFESSDSSAYSRPQSIYGTTSNAVCRTKDNLGVWLTIYYRAGLQQRVTGVILVRWARIMLAGNNIMLFNKKTFNSPSN